MPHTCRISLWLIAPGLVKFMIPVSLRCAIGAGAAGSGGAWAEGLGCLGERAMAAAQQRHVPAGVSQHTLAISRLYGSSSGSTVIELGMLTTLSYLQV